MRDKEQPKKTQPSGGSSITRSAAPDAAAQQNPIYAGSQFEYDLLTVSHNDLGPTLLAELNDSQDQVSADSSEGDVQFVTIGGRVIPIHDKGSSGSKKGTGKSESSSVSRSENAREKETHQKHERESQPSVRQKESPEELKARTDRVMGKLPKIHTAIPRLRKNVESDLDKADAARERVAAAVVRIMDATTMRVGSEKYAQGNGSFGASSLRKNHVAVEGDTVRMKFRGKSGKDWDRSIRDPELASAVRHLLSLPGERLMQFHDARGGLKPMTEEGVRDYMAAHGMTPKNLRTYHASRLAAEILERMGPPKNEAEARANINKAVKQTSEHLGNTPAICRASYINPVILEAYAHSVSTHKVDAQKPTHIEDFGRYLTDLEKRVQDGQLSGHDPFPEDREEVEIDDEAGEPSDKEAQADAEYNRHWNRYYGSPPPSVDPTTAPPLPPTDEEDEDLNSANPGSGIFAPRKDSRPAEPMRSTHSPPDTSPPLVPADDLPASEREAYLLSDVLVSGPKDFQILTDAAREKGVLLRVRQPAMRCDHRNANGRYYPRAVVQKALNDCAERVAAGVMFSNLLHPDEAEKQKGRLVVRVFEDNVYARSASVDMIVGIDAAGWIFIDRSIRNTKAGREVARKFRENRPYGLSTRFTADGDNGVIDGLPTFIATDMSIHTWDDVPNPAFADAGKEFTLLKDCCNFTDSAREALGLHGDGEFPSSPPSVTGKHSTHQANRGDSNAPEQELHRMKTDVIRALNRYDSAVAKRAPWTEIDTLRKLATDAIEDLAKTEEDISEYTARLARIDSVISAAKTAISGRPGPEPVPGSNSGEQPEGCGWAGELETKQTGQDPKDPPVPGHAPVNASDALAKLDPAKLAALIERQERQEQQERAAQADAQRKQAIADAVEAERGLLDKLDVEEQELLMEFVKTAAQDAADVPSLLADTLMKYSSVAARHERIGRGMETRRGNSVDDPASPEYREREKALTRITEGHQVLAKAFGDGQWPAAMKGVDQMMLATDRAMRQSHMPDVPDPDDPATISRRINNCRLLQPILNDYASRYHGKETMQELLLKDDAFTTGGERAFTDAVLGPMEGRSVRADSVTTANYLNQPLVIFTILLQMFWDMVCFEFVQSYGPGIGGEGKIGWMPNPISPSGNLGSIFRIPVKYFDDGAMSGYATPPVPQWNESFLVPEGQGIDEIITHVRWLSYAPAMRRIAISATTDVIRAMAGGPLNFDVLASLLFDMVFAHSRAIDKDLADEMGNVADEFGAVPVSAETPNLTNNSVYPAAGAVTVNLNPTKTASTAPVPGTDNSVTYGTGVNTGSGGTKEGYAVAGAIRLAGPQAGTGSPYCGQTVQTLGGAATLPSAIVRPRTTYDFNTNGVPAGTLINPVTVTLGGTGAAGKNAPVLGYLDRLGNIHSTAAQVAAGQVANCAIDWNNGVFVFTANFNALVQAAPIAALALNTTVTLAYSYSTNWDAFQANNVTLPSGQTYSMYLANFLLQIDRSAALMGSDGKFVKPDLCLGSLNVSADVINAQNFYQWASPAGTVLYPNNDYYAHRNGINFARMNVIWNIVDSALLLLKKGTTKHAIDHPFSVVPPQFPVDSSGRPIAKRSLYGEDRRAIFTPLVITDSTGTPANTVLNPVSRKIRRF